MKKLLLLFVATTTMTFVNASEVDSTTVKMFNTVYSDVRAGLSGIAGGLEIGVDHVYPIMVKQQFVDSVSYLSVTIVLLIIIGICLKVGGANKWEDEPIVIPCIIIPIICGVGLIFMILNIDTIAMGFLNPEYGAIKEIMSFVKR